MDNIFDLEIFNDNLFFPRSDPRPTPTGCRDLFAKVEQGVEIHIRVYNNPQAKFSLVHFHGNGEIVADHDSMASRFSESGAQFISCDYRGYGKSSGRPTLRALLEDAHKIFDFLIEEGALLEKVAVMGRSLGSAPAIEVCAKKKMWACIIESGYGDPVQLAIRRGLPPEMVTEESARDFNNSRKIIGVKCPLLIMHGAWDQIISVDEANLNHKNAGSQRKSLKIFDSVGHNDIMFAANDGYFSTLHEFFQSLLSGK